MLGVTGSSPVPPRKFHKGDSWRVQYRPTMVKCFFTTVLLSLVLPVFAQAGLNITIQEEDGKITILRCRGTVKELVIPDAINGKPVVAIADYAFAKKEISTVTIPDSVTSIGNGAFAENRLTEVTIGDNVTSLGRGAFSDNRISKVVIGKGLTELSRGCFQVNFLSAVEIPDNITAIGDYAFYNNRLSSITIPQSVTSIGEGAFANNYLKTLAITGGVKKILDGAFYNNELASITVPSGIEEIGKRVFNNKPKSSALKSRVNYMDTHDKILFTTDGNFDTYFESQERKPGAYVFADGAWSVK